MYLLHTEGNNGRVSSVCVHVFYVQRYAGDNAARCQGAKLNPQERGVRPTRASVMALRISVCRDMLRFLSCWE